MGTLSNNSKIGDKNKDLILQTLGRVYVQVRDRFYEIHFRENDNTDKNKEENDDDKSLILLDSENDINELEYPGENCLILTKDGKVFISQSGSYIQIPIATAVITTYNTPLTITSIEAPLNISSNKLVKNLNAEYLNGFSSDKFLKKNVPEKIDQPWTFNQIIANNISDANKNNTLDLVNGILTIDTINVNNFNGNPDTNSVDNDNISNSTIDIINKPTYISGGLKILSVKQINKTDDYFLYNDGWDSYNENAIVGGFSISDLIKYAFDNEYLNSDNSIAYYFNLLTNILKYDELSKTWLPYTVVDDDFYSDYSEPLYTTLKFSPKNRNVFESVQYGINDNCATKIYDKWYDISNYSGAIASKYTGVTYECIVEPNNLNAGTELYGNGIRGKLEGLLVGSTGSTVRIITTGTDCEFLYMDYEGDDKNKKIENCIESNIDEEGVSISAKIEKNDILFAKSTINVIGQLDGIENSVFGALSDYGISSEGNCYLINPNIALVNMSNVNYVKLTSDYKSFIGINNKSENFITVETNGNCSIQRNPMYNINNYLSSCYFGPLIINDDGSATIGDGATQITISSLGEVKIPRAAII